MEDRKRDKLVNRLFYVALAIMVGVYTYLTVKTFAPVKAYIGDEVWYPTAAYNYLKFIFHVTPPMYFPYSNESGIATYMNYSHPPLAKFIMDIFIAILGYYPIAWRLPSWILGDLMLIVAFFLGSSLLGGGKIGKLGGLMAAFMIAMDPNLWLLHGIAMLDIYVSFFAFLSFYFLMKDKILLASIFLGLAAASKEPALVLIFPFLYYVGEVMKSPLRRTIYGIVIPAFAYLAVSSPIIAYTGGLIQWIKIKYYHMVAWDITNGHIALSAVSQISTPWGWFLDIHPFYMGHGFYANINPLVMFLWLFSTPIAFILREKKMIMLTMFGWTEWLGFLAVYFLGNHTMFSFYYTDFAPFVDTYVVVSLFALGKKMLARKPSKDVRAEIPQIPK
ncbi:glycosyltransferase [Candidatus Acidianus copahuensis]|uniref:Glycosyltransferase n=1 Tax=Candidatus Acidianus copahuensis TaxID=1160895 RepID=A0A031LUU0_9CREN|nr:glycosyltransferase family 39 protein [Candidatus Acidianus copahuensis]EZQ11259.1 glycosyltransferase [Candidatus Acidianus copahuensis]